MTDAQLYLAIGIPIAVNILFNGTAFLLLSTGLNRRMDDLRDLWRAELRRVEEVLDARLKHVEDKLGIR